MWRKVLAFLRASAAPREPSLLRNRDLLLQKIAERDPRFVQLLRDQRAGGESRQRVELEKVHAILARDQIGARIAFAAEGDVRGDGDRLRLVAHRIRDFRGAD